MWFALLVAVVEDKQEEADQATPEVVAVAAGLGTQTISLLLLVLLMQW